MLTADSPTAPTVALRVFRAIGRPDLADRVCQAAGDLGGEVPHSMHEMLIRLVEKPLLEVVMQHSDGNQSKAAEWLGINRNTLHRKLVEHKFIK